MTACHDRDGIRADERTNIDAHTAIATGFAAYAAADVIHELLGHGGACLAAGGRLLALSSVHLDCDLALLPSAAARVMTAGGVLANLAAGLGLAWRLRRPIASPASRYILWLTATTNLFMAGGYPLFMPIIDQGDARDLIAGLPHRELLRWGLVVWGAAVSAWALRLAAAGLEPFLGQAGEERRRRARALILPPYLAGSGLFCVASLLNRTGRLWALVAAASFSFLGTACFPLLSIWLGRKRGEGLASAPSLGLPRSKGWITAGWGTALLFVRVLGPAVDVAH